MSEQDLFTAIGLPPMNAADLGVSPPPAAPPPPVAPPAPNLQKPFALALLAGALAGGKATNGLVSGVIQQHQALNLERQRQQLLMQQEAERQQQIVAEQQKIYQAQLQKRAEDYKDIIMGPNGFHAAVMKATTPEAYDQQVQYYSSLLRRLGYTGSSSDPNTLRATAPFVVESDAQKASKLVEKLLKDPLNAESIKTDPQSFLKGQALFQSNADKFPRMYPLTQLFALGDHQIVMGADGKPLILKPQDGKVGTAFQELMKNGLDAFKAQYNREPTAKERQAITQRAIEQSKEKPPAANSSELDLPIWVFDASKPGTDGNTPDPNLRMTPNAVYQAAINYIKSGRFPPTGLGTQPWAKAVRSAVLNKSGAIAAAANMDIPTMGAVFKANSGALQQQQKFYDSAQAFLATADRNSELLNDTLKKLPDTGSPMFNRPLRQFEQTVRGDPNLSQFATYLRSVQNEYAKIITNPNLVGQLTDAARSEAETLIRPDATVPQLIASIQALQAEGNNRLLSIGEQIQKIQGRMSGTGAAPTIAAPTSTGPAIKTYNPATGRVE